MTERMDLRLYWVQLVLVLCSIQIFYVTSQTIPKLNINPSGITISGISSGGAFAVQYHVAHSSILQGAAIFAGVPYYCAQDDLEVALSSCTDDPSYISVDELVAATTTAYSLDSIDNPLYLANSKVWMWSGIKDTIVHQGVMDKLYTYYSWYVKESSIVYWKNISSEHAWISNTYGNPCPYLGSPFINNCNIDAPGQLLRHLYPRDALKSVSKNPNNFYTFSQRDFLPLDVLDLAEISLGEKGFIYIPQACKEGQQCKLHFCFHGCEQNYASINTSFVNNTGLNEWAEGSKIVVVYPQTSNSPDEPYNPEGCWDWWGYSGPEYATQEAPQIETVYNMMITILSGQSTPIKSNGKLVKVV